MPAARWVTPVVLVLLLAGCDASEPVVITGQAMGARYHVKLMGGHPPVDALEQSLAELLDAIEDEASQWREASWVSRFNAGGSARPVSVPPHVWAMLVEAERVYGQSGGVFDITAGPLVELWGFGESPGSGPPTPARLAETLKRCGGDKLLLDHAGRTAAKAVPGLALDLSGLAKGYAVDAAAALLDEAGVEHYLIAFGGEVYARGNGPGGDGWRVEVERAGGAKRVITLRNQAAATSGGGQQHKQTNGVGYATHLIDPRSGLSMSDPSRSVTVLAPRAVTADAWATVSAVLTDADLLHASVPSGVEVLGEE